MLGVLDDLLGVVLEEVLEEVQVLITLLQDDLSVFVLHLVVSVVVLHGVLEEVSVDVHDVLEEVEVLQGVISSDVVVVHVSGFVIDVHVVVVHVVEHVVEQPR